MTTLNLTKPIPPDIVNLTAFPGVKSILLEWNPIADINLFSVNVYRSETNDRNTAVNFGPGAQLSSQYVDGVITPGTTYYYWARSVDTDGNATGNWSSGQFDGVSTTAPLLTAADIRLGSIISSTTFSNPDVTVSTWDSYQLLESSNVSVIETGGTLIIDYGFTNKITPQLANNSWYSTQIKFEVVGLQSKEIISSFTSRGANVPQPNLINFYDRNPRGRLAVDVVAGQTYTVNLWLKQTRSGATVSGQTVAADINLTTLLVHK